MATSHYNLLTYGSSGVPQFRNDWDATMNKIDMQMYNNSRIEPNSIGFSSADSRGWKAQQITLLDGTTVKGGIYKKQISGLEVNQNTGTVQTVQLPVGFSGGTDYLVFVQITRLTLDSGSGTNDVAAWPCNQTSSSFRIQVWNNSNFTVGFGLNVILMPA